MYLTDNGDKQVRKDEGADENEENNVPSVKRVTQIIQLNLNSCPTVGGYKHEKRQEPISKAMKNSWANQK